MLAISPIRASALTVDFSYIIIKPTNPAIRRYFSWAMSVGTHYVTENHKRHITPTL